MNKIIALTFCLGLALAQVTRAEDTNNKKNKKKHPNRTTAAQAAAQHPVGPNTHVQNRTMTTSPSFHQVVRHPSSQSQFQKNTNVNHVVVKQNRTITNRNSFIIASRRNWHIRHDHIWWRNHFHTFVIFGGGYYFWDGGYWYPAYGYDPAYSTYAYDEPIYGYNQLPPGQVISNVQAELQREGYYNGAIDGLLGPMTRDALARYQGDHELIVTRAIDEPTLQSLGLV